MTVKTEANGTLCWFDIPYDDRERAHKFYGELFGWTFGSHEASPIPYDFALGSAEVQCAPDPKMNGCCGGLMPRQKGAHPILLYFKVPSIEPLYGKIAELGGEVVCPKQEVPEYGAFAVIKDSEGNMLAIWEVAS